jgi:hypothetical protein
VTVPEGADSSRANVARREVGTLFDTGDAEPTSESDRLDILGHPCVSIFDQGLRESRS